MKVARRVRRAAYTGGNTGRALRVDLTDTKAKPTPKPSSPWPADASTSSGPCSATAPSTSPQQLPRRLDNVIENPFQPDLGPQDSKT